jgi:hypothetical protein
LIDVAGRSLNQIVQNKAGACHRITRVGGGERDNNNNNNNNNNNSSSSTDVWLWE